MSPSDPAAKPKIRWVGGIVHPRRMTHAGKPMRVAAWITRGGSLLGAAIVEGHGPTVLHDLLDELLEHTPADERPDLLVVWPSARVAFRGLEYPPVKLERDEFVITVIEDEISAGFVGDFPVRRGAAQPAANKRKPRRRPPS